MKEAVMAVLGRNPGKAWKTKELARAAQISKQGPMYLSFKALLRQLQEEGVIERLPGSRWMLPANENEMHSERATEKLVVGTVKELRRLFFLEADDNREFREDIAVRSKNLNGAADGDKVVLKLLPRSRGGAVVEGEVIEVLGRRGRAEVELLAVARRFGLSTSFPDEVIDQVMRMPADISEDEFSKRLDLREIECFTIDPENAQDFDDAVSLRETDDGFELAVHIADVSHYVQPGTPTDREALRRGTSVYLVNGVVPMLPERLSNHICCLQEGKNRLACSVIMQIGVRGAVRDFTLRKSVIRSRRRFTYEEVQRILDDGGGPHYDTLRKMEILANTLMRKRIREGAIDFSLPEVGFRFDDNGYPLEIISKPRLMSMRIIEEFMLLANRTVARAVADAKPARPFMYRIHDPPDPEKVAELVNVMNLLGMSVQIDPSSSRSFQDMLNQIRGRPEEDVVQGLTIRAMAKALYSEKNSGHYGLGFRWYTHFTSPIRRYPDLLAHRLCTGYFGEQHAKIRSSLTRQQMAEIAYQCSATERLAVEAERESIRIKQIEYMKRHEGYEYSGIIGGVTAFGLYVALDDILVEGLVHIRSLDDDYYRFDEFGRRLIGVRSGKLYRLGDSVRVQVARVDTGTRQIDFLLINDSRTKVSPFLQTKKTSNSGSHRGDQRSGQNTRRRRRRK